MYFQFMATNNPIIALISENRELKRVKVDGRWPQINIFHGFCGTTIICTGLDRIETGPGMLASDCRSGSACHGPDK